MRAVLQRVARAEVRVDGVIVGAIGRGLVALVGVAPDELKGWFLIVNARSKGGAVRTRIDRLAAKLMANEQLLWDAVVVCPRSQSYRRDMLKRMKDVTWRPRLASLKFCNMRRVSFIHTSGDAPKGQLATYIRPEYDQHGRVIPRGYPGWQGQVDIEVQTHAKMQGWYLSSEWMNAIRIYTGTGGGGGGPKTDIQRFSYSVTIFEDDWPGMKRVYERERMMNILKGEYD